MRKLVTSNTFKRDMKREKKGINRKAVEDELPVILGNLLNDIALDEKYVDHSLKGRWEGYRDCHVRPDLILIYSKKTDEDGVHVLNLIRLGSHNELF